MAISQEALDLADGDEIFIFTWPSANPEVAAANMAAFGAFNQTDPL